PLRARGFAGFLPPLTGRRAAGFLPALAAGFRPAGLAGALARRVPLALVVVFRPPEAVPAAFRGGGGRKAASASAPPIAWATSGIGAMRSTVRSAPLRR